jgi:hypothetical protein
MTATPYLVRLSNMPNLRIVRHHHLPHLPLRNYGTVLLYSSAAPSPHKSPEALQASFYSLYLSVDELEDVVENKVLAVAVSGELEGLRVAHGALLFINLNERWGRRARKRQSYGIWEWRKAILDAIRAISGDMV